ncbi:MAG: hypothetical protein EAZ57_05260 [Cytophagales bacterium]|nr:MAG: hypothetical protein EAZ67_06320 [Cytophagales bacterium]TAF60958.1 MAG: hypothetical protein EAZ57_05260 [Cytophagales bacterium]
MKITQDIQRLILHDARFKNEIRTNNDLVITFDFARLKHLTELGIHETVVLGKTTLAIKGIKNEQLKAYYEGPKYRLIDFPENVGKYWNEVQNTEIDEHQKRLQLDGLFSKDGENFWVEWSLNYESCEVEWDSHITVAQWYDGQQPDE